MADAVGDDVAGVFPSELVWVERSDRWRNLYDSRAMRRFAGIDLGDDRIPDEATI